MFSATDTHLPSFEEYAAVSWSRLYRSAYLLAGNHADAEDLAQQTLIKVHHAWDRVSASDSIDAYVRRILTNAFLSSRRHRRRRLELLTDALPESTAIAATSEDRTVLWPHVRELPPRQRAVVVLRYYEDLSEAEIAATLGCSRGTVKSTAHRALKSLRSVLDEQDRLGSEGREG